ncbi:MAG: hypothetical protein KAT04_11895 [Methylococcales bacterium]|nr:hypothetical protein [Methylococcales bacterium]
MKKTIKTPIAAAIGTAVVSTFTTTVNAETNPFSMTELSDGYMQIAQSDGSANYTVKPWGKKANEASCGEGKCGGMMNGDKMKKGMESSCGAMMKGKEGSCGEMDKASKKSSEGKCGEGKCAGMMSGNKMKKGMESSCGSMMKGKEGACGEMDKSSEMSCGGMMKKMKGMKGGDMSCGAMMDKMKGGEM